MDEFRVHLEYFLLTCSRDREKRTHKRDRHTRDSQRHWDRFYHVRETRGFKDRHYLTDIWPELLERDIIVSELGCGVGNTIFPLLEENPSLRFLGCDISEVAIKVLKQHPAYDPVHIRVWGGVDLARHLPSDMHGKSDVSMLMFVLSAVGEHIGSVLKNAYLSLKPGGILLLRDYGNQDHAADRFDKRSQLTKSIFVRSDGTLSNFFSVEAMNMYLRAAAFDPEVCLVEERVIVNRAMALTMERKFIVVRARKKCKKTP